MGRRSNDWASRWPLTKIIAGTADTTQVRGAQPKVCQATTRMTAMARTVSRNRSRVAGPRAAAPEADGGGHQGPVIAEQRDGGSLDGDRATTLAYFFEIVDDNLVLIGTYQHRLVRHHDRWRFAHLRITVRYRGRLAVEDLQGRTLRSIVAEPL